MPFRLSEWRNFSPKQQPNPEPKKYLLKQIFKTKCPKHTGYWGFGHYFEIKIVQPEQTKSPSWKRTWPELQMFFVSHSLRFDDLC